MGLAVGRVLERPKRCYAERSLAHSALEAQLVHDLADDAHLLRHVDRLVALRAHVARSTQLQRTRPLLRVEVTGRPPLHTTSSAASLAALATKRPRGGSSATAPAHLVEGAASATPTSDLVKGVASPGRRASALPKRCRRTATTSHLIEGVAATTTTHLVERIGRRGWSGLRSLAERGAAPAAHLVKGVAAGSGSWGGLRRWGRSCRVALLAVSLVLVCGWRRDRLGSGGLCVLLCLVVATVRTPPRSVRRCRRERRRGVGEVHSTHPSARLVYSVILAVALLAVALL
mmetsp:Transcript_37416/g.87012  ORF Transcript_37416/g.87012 Transcript_37416/m.87012 type:complete len:288 (-) Transcript_37416:514-1377(-)